MKVYVVKSRMFDSIVGVYTDPELARKLAVTQAGDVIETELDYVHPGHNAHMEEIYKKG